MKLTIFTYGLIFVSTTLFAQNAVTDEMAINKVVQQQEDAWNAHDWEKLSGYFTEDATLINFVGQFWKGSNEILGHFRLLSACCLEPTSLKFEVKSIRFLTPDIAIVYTEETLSADRDYEVPFHQYKKSDTDYKWKTDVFIKKNKEWKITSTQLTLINQMITPYESSDKN